MVDPGSSPDAFERSRFTQVLTVCVFAAAMVAPLIVGLLGGAKDDGVRREFRAKAPVPVLPAKWSEWFTLAGRFDRWYGDSFGLRGELLAAANRVHVLGLGVSPSDRLLVGEDRWIFHLNSDALATARGTRTMDPAQLDLWAVALSARAAWHRKRGTQYLFVLIPSKFEIYPEKLSFDLRPVGPSPREQFTSYLTGLARSSPRLDDFCLDLEPELQRVKRSLGPGVFLYHPYGVHWNDRGAFVGYQGILRGLRGVGAREGRGLNIEPWGADDFRSVAGGAIPDSWGRKLYLEGSLPNREPHLEPIRARQARPARAPDAAGPGDLIWTRPAAQPHGEPSGVEPLSATVHHDSFGAWLLPYLAEHFPRMRSVNGDVFSAPRYPSGSGSVVIEVYSERVLVQRPPGFPVDAIQERLLAGFDGAAAGPTLSVDLSRPLPVYPGYGAILQEPVARQSQGSDGGAGSSSFLDLTVEGAGNVLLFDGPKDTPEGTVPVLVLDLEGEKDFRTDVFFNTEPDQTFHPHRSFSASGKAGRRRLAIPFTEPLMIGQLGLRVAAQPGRYRLRGFEVRSVPIRSLR